MKQNSDLKAFYESIYQVGETKYFSKFENGSNKSENEEIVLKHLGDLNNKKVLDIGCGTGSLVQKIAEAGAAHVIGIDYSETAIKTAQSTHHHPNAQYRFVDFTTWNEPMDIIISCGTFEHLDDPQEMMNKISSLLNPGGTMILTCPHFYNIRGIIWITLQKLLNIPMSLTDVHSISPADMVRWSKNCNLELDIIESFDYARGNSQWMIEDLKKRLTNALKDANYPNDKVDLLLNWLNDYVKYNESSTDPNHLDGATCLYKFVKNN
jgi:2-polyprenyl-3-methyl-5-hydroxy-6-metoxy-1,4-benzoquinol methylase